jgi:hypothetical protein
MYSQKLKHFPFPLGTGFRISISEKKKTKNRWRKTSRSHDLGQDGVDLDFFEEVLRPGNRLSGEKGEVPSSESELRCLLAGPGPSVGPVEDPLSLCWVGNHFVEVEVEVEGLCSNEI